MSNFARRMSKSWVGSAILALFLIVLLAGFALQDIRSYLSGAGSSSGALAEVGGEEVTDREVTGAMQRRLAEVRQSNAGVDYSAIAKDFDPLMDLMIQGAAIRAFAADQDMTLSKRLVDAEIAKIPATRGLDGKFSQASYQNFLAQQKLSDAELRKIVTSSMLQRIVLGAGSANARVPVGVATPYASMLLEEREAEVLTIPVARFLGSIPAPSDADLTTYYRANARAYTIPEQRVIDVARIGPAQVANAVPTDKEITDYYNANQAIYGGTTRRVISQVVLQSKPQADSIVARARGGSFADAAKPAGFSAADISVGPQTRDQLAKLTSDKIAAAAFGAASGAVVGPIQSDLGWHVIKIDGIQAEAGKSLAAARAEIVAKLSVDKRKNVLADLVTKVEDLIAEGSGFSDAVKAAGLTSVKSPPLLGNGTSRANPGFKLPAELAPVVSAAFGMAQGDEPLVETLPGEAGYALVGLDQVIPAAPAQLAAIRDKVAADWKNAQARARARTVASAIAARVAKGETLAAATTAAGAGLPPPNKAAIRRIQLAQMQGNIPPALNLMFALSAGGSRMIADPGGRGFTIIKLLRIVPGNATLQPSLISRTQTEFQQAVSSEYAEQMVRAMQVELGVKRNAKAIEATRKRILGS